MRDIGDIHDTGTIDQPVLEFLLDPTGYTDGACWPRNGVVVIYLRQRFSADRLASTLDHELVHLNGILDESQVRWVQDQIDTWLARSVN